MLACPPHSFSPQRTRTWKDDHLDPGLRSTCRAAGHTEVEAGVGSCDGRDEQCGDVCVLRPGLPHSEKGELPPEGPRQAGMARVGGRGIKGRGKHKANIRAQLDTKGGRARQQTTRLTATTCQEDD